MANIYVDGELASGANNGTSWTNAYQGGAGLQTAFDFAVAADVVRLTRTFTLAATIDIDTNSGTTENPIRVLGYNYNGGSPTVDGAFAVLDANSAVNNCTLGNNIDSWVMENIEFKNALQDNIQAVGSPLEKWAFINCHSHHAGLGGVSGSGWGNDVTDRYRFSVFVLCKSYSNLDNGFHTYSSGFFGCSSYNNGGYGFGGPYNHYSNSLAYSNTDEGFTCDSGEHLITNCVSDGNGTGFYIGSGDGPMAIIGCRITNNTIGIDGSAGTPALVLDLYNFFNGNGTNFGDVTVLNQVRGQSTRTASGIEGYVNRAAGNYALLDVAAARRTEVQL